MTPERREEILAYKYKRSVYVVSGTGGPIKVGMSINPRYRIDGLRSECTGLPPDLRVVAAYPRKAGDAHIVERIAHKLLREKRAFGEWFNVTEREAVATVKEAIRIVDSGDLSIIQGRRDRIDLCAGDDLCLALDEWRVGQPGIPSRAEAARRMVEHFLTLEGVYKPKSAKPPAKRKAGS